MNMEIPPVPDSGPKIEVPEAIRRFIRQEQDRREGGPPRETIEIESADEFAEYVPHSPEFYTEIQDFLAKNLDASPEQAPSNATDELMHLAQYKKALRLMLTTNRKEEFKALVGSTRAYVPSRLFTVSQKCEQKKEWQEIGERVRRELLSGFTPKEWESVMKRLDGYHRLEPNFKQIPPEQWFNFDKKKLLDTVQSPETTS